MRKLTAFLTLVCTFLGCAFKSQATHTIGGEIFYEAVAPGVFIATYREYYSGTFGTSPSTSKQFNLRSPGCNNGRIIYGAAQSNNALYINGGSTNNCNASLPGFVTAVTYIATISINNSQLTCPDWYLSVQECSRGASANILTSQSQNACLYTEAYLNVVHANMQTMAPEFLLPTSWIFNVNNPATYSNLTVQKSNKQDSIAYALKPALNDHNLPLAYSVNTSFAQPIPSSSGVSINPKTGLMTFTPNVFQNSSSLVSNTYTIVVEAAVYRKINGTMTKVSASQRNLPIYIVNNSGNANPELTNVTANGQPAQANEVVQIRSGNTLTFQFNTADANAGDNLILVLPDLQFIGFPSNTTASITPGTRPSGTLTFNTTPSATDQFFYFPVTVMDNACPARGVTTQIYGVKILASPLGVQEERPEVRFAAFPNPFTETVTFSFNKPTDLQSILIYNLMGQQVDKIHLKTVDLGEQKVQWQNAHKHAAGIYIAKLVSTDKTIQTLKFTKLQ